MSGVLEWRTRDRDHHLYRDGRRIASLLFNTEGTKHAGVFLWISSIIEGPNGGWHAVDFLSVEYGRHALEEWAAGITYNDNDPAMEHAQPCQ